MNSLEFIKKGVEKTLVKKNISGVIRSYFSGEIPDYTIDYIFGIYNNARFIFFHELKKGRVAFNKTIDYLVKKADKENYLFIIP